MDELKIEACARAAHEANRNYCYAIGDASQVPWESAPQWQKDSIIDGVHHALQGGTPRTSHENWYRHKVAAGWTYGDTKDPEKKTHHCLVPYDDLPPTQKVKDDIFISTVRTMANALGLPLLRVGGHSVGVAKKGAPPAPPPEGETVTPPRSARELYERYVEASGGLNFRGDPCPTWDELPEKIRGNWESVASFARG